MAASSSTRETVIVFAGEVGGTQEILAAENATAPNCITKHVLVGGANAIPVPTGATCATIVKASDNAVSISIGSLRLHDTDPDSVSLHSSSTVLTLTLVAATTATVRIFWS